MEDIQQVLNQNVNLAVLDGWEALFVERLSPAGSVPTGPGRRRMPVHISSAGLALMAHQSRELQASTSTVPDPSGKVTADVVRHLLAETAHQGYAQLAGVVDPDTWGIAVP